VADLGEGPGGPTSPSPPIYGEKEVITEGRKAGSASKTKLLLPPPPPPPPLLA